MKIVTKYITAYVLILFVCFVGIVMCNCFPSKLIYNNVKTSALLLEKEGTSPSSLFRYPFTHRDNFTDALMMNISYTSDNNKPIHSSMSQSYYNGGCPVHDLYELTNDNENGLMQLQKEDYSYYWHGYQVILRPLLFFLDYGKIRILNYIVILGLFAWVCYFLYAVRKIYVPFFLFCLFLFDYQSVPLTMLSSIDVIIALAGSIVLIKIGKGKDNIPLLLFVIGALTSFFDLLCTPIITFSIPFLVWGLCSPCNHKIRLMIQGAIAWSAGYLLLWGAKWIIGSYILDYDVLGHAFSQIKYRMSGELWNGKGTRLFLLMQILKYWYYLLPAFLIVSFAYWKLFKGIDVLKHWVWLFVLAFVPIVWSFVAFQHTFLHFHFTMRIGMVSLLCFLLFLYHTTSLHKNASSYI